MSKSNVLYAYTPIKTKSASSDKDNQRQETSVKHNTGLQKLHPKKLSIVNVDQVFVSNQLWTVYLTLYDYFRDKILSISVHKY